MLMQIKRNKKKVKFYTFTSIEKYLRTHQLTKEERDKIARKALTLLTCPNLEFDFVEYYKRAFNKYINDLRCHDS